MTKSSFYEAKDAHGNKWPNWKVEKFVPSAVRHLIGAFNSTVPSRGREVKYLNMGLGSSGWTHAEREKSEYDRPTIRQLLRSYYEG